MQMRQAWRAAAALTLLLQAGAVSAAEGSAVRIELNRLEALDKACRVYLVLANAGADSFDTFKLDLVLFDTDGVIARRLAVEAAPLRAEKTSVKLFDLDGLACDRVGTVLVNDVLVCSTAKGPVEDCVAQVETASRTSAKLVK